MDNLLAFYNIKTVGFIDSEYVDRTFAFSQKMAAADIFIEYCYIYAFPEVKEDTDFDTFVREAEEAENGGRLSIIMKQGNRYYEFLMYHETIEIAVPVILVQTIIFLVRLIEDAAPENLIDYLTRISVEPLIPHEMKDRKHRNMAKKMLELKIQTVQDLIGIDKAGHN